MGKQKLFTEMTINNCDASITARCPDEDNEMCVTIKNRYKVNFMLTLTEANDFADFIKEHVKAAKEAETSCA